ncbi:hypothetical protein WJ0W_001800 [Paenibacillus melissococcoides]|uniref:Uncharacterized protein n=1 Tax=Paenibacillus melissococcoides TaxID=2912268 RepID=A0ABN8U4U2_9BACL|nr:hypothetical protein [Paenibacillus melissococcoides]MEB9895679.1 hypothetical protein [Bacillus cereus]CAH8244566.1 hypothetical protein WJ0W_001800 [Paenibacillus melissococcoides]CAH8708363.1 hypothetical protein WDD9_001887 [Paenibacillus melissococcoides]CAH8709071.1 hypothetical protein HTL2_002172 [Paenibacillus melissococcoides]
MKNQLQIFEDEFLNENSGEVVKGVTVVVDGYFKQVLDTILQNEKSYDGYTNLIANALARGINKTIK